ncbi:MAG: ectonucleotide pyrophosphatase/phosphodiesterase [Thermoanaerobaculia bacterium]
MFPGPRIGGERSLRGVPVLAAAGLFVALLTTGGCSAVRRAETSPPTLILVSFDGFRWDYLDRVETPALDRLAAAGVRAERLIPSFPTKTFPNHYTIVTGLYPEHHGIVSNNIRDPQLADRFALRNRDAVQDPRWWHGEPIWRTAQRQGHRAAPYFWPGSEAPIGGRRADFWQVYDGSVTHEQRVDRVLELLDLPTAERPVFATIYFSDPDDAGHRHGPDAQAEVVAAVQRVDAALGRLVDGLEERGLWERSHVVVVSDHGMIATPPGQVIVLDDHVDLETANVVDWAPVLAVWPEPEDVDAVYDSLAGAHPHLTVYRKEDVPGEWHYQDSPRIAPIIGLVDGGWRVTSRGYLELRGGRLGLGDHGFHPQLEGMGALFVAAGPGLRRGEVVPPFSNVHLYELMCHLLGLEPAPNDGSLTAVRHLLADGG